MAAPQQVQVAAPTEPAVDVKKLIKDSRRETVELLLGLAHVAQFVQNPV